LTESQRWNSSFRLTTRPDRILRAANIKANYACGALWQRSELAGMASASGKNDWPVC